VRSGRYQVMVHTADGDESLRAEMVLRNAGAEQVHTSPAP
jgi:hypothetical protein